MSRSTSPSAEKVFSANDPAVADHQVHDKLVVPFAAWIAWAQELIVGSSANSSREFTDLFVRKPLVIDERTAQTVRFNSAEDGTDAGWFRIHSADPAVVGSDPEPIVEGRWRIPQGVVQPLSVPAAETSWMSADFYGAARRRGLSYGPSYRRVEQIGYSSAGWRAEIRLVNTAADPIQRQVTALDAMLQGGAVLSAKAETECWVPYRIDLARLNPEAGFADSSQGMVVGRWNAAQTNERVADVDWIDLRSERIVAQFRGIRYRTAPAREATLPAAASHAKSATGGKASGGPPILLDRLRATDVAARQELLASSIEEYVLQLLKWNESRRKDLSRGFVAIGLDSLLAVDLQFRLQTELKFSLPPGTGLNQPTIADLAAFLLSQHPELRA